MKTKNYTAVVHISINEYSTIDDYMVSLGEIRKAQYNVNWYEIRYP